MKQLAPALQAHLIEGTTTMAWCWRITRADGVAFGFTDHDRTLTFEGTDFEPESGFTASEVRAGSDLSVDAQDAEGVLSSDRITETDILDGRWDNAEVELWRVNWADTGQRVLLRRGAIGQVRRGRVAFVAEVRSLAHVLGQTVGRTFQAGCDAALGDGRCGVNLEAAAFRGTGAVTDILRDRAFTASGLGAFAAGWFTHGTVEWTSGANAGRRAEVLAHDLVDGLAILTLLEAPVRAIAETDGFIARAGCDKRVASCSGKFANVANFRGFAGSVDKTATAATQVASLFGGATPANFSVSGEAVSWTGPTGDWGLRRMILHYAHLCAAAGGVDAFLIGSEMRGLTTIRSGASSYPAVQAFRDLAAAVRQILGAATKISYAADWSEYFGHQPGDGSGDVFFHLDPLWADANTNFIAIDNYMPLSDWRDGFEHLDAQAGWPAIHDRGYLQANIAGGEGYDWFYDSEADRSAQVRTPISDGAAGKPWVFRYKDLRAWWSNAHYNRPGGVEAATPTTWVPKSKPVWFTELGCPAIDRGTNQPNVFFDPKSSESFTPYFSRGWRDDAIQRAYLEATYLWWGTPANNPTSSVYGGRMVHVPECAAWTWDARPYPFFPALEGVWTDGPNWRLGHWLTGRLGAVSLAALIRHLCLRAGLPAHRIDVTGLWGAVEGYVIGALESPRASITTLARHFGFDAVETGGVIRFVMRGRAAVAELGPDDLAAAPDPRAEGLELTRAQETELPQALKWQLARADEDYDAAQVEAQRITVSASRIASEAFPMAVAPEEAERRCRRALMEAWIGRETASFRLPPSRLALDPADVIRLQHDGRSLNFRLLSTADAETRGIEAIRQDRAAYDLPPGDPRPATLARPLVLTAPDVAFLDLPQLTEDQPAHRPFLAAHARPWPGELAVFRSPGSDGFELQTTVPARARMGGLAFDLWPGPVSRFDLGNTLTLDLFTGSLESVTDLALFGGANALAIEASPGVWEIVQAGTVELIAPGRYRLTRLLRGQRGTEGAMGQPAPAGVRVVVLDSTLAPLPIALGDIGLPWNWRVGPARRPPSDETYVAQPFTPAGTGLRPFAPVHVEQPWRRARVPGDLTIRWTRRSRALEADAWEQVEVPVGEEVEDYEIEIRDGAAVKRVLTSGTTSVLYTAAQQTTDWGALLGPGDTLALRIFQFSARLGRGAPASVTLQF